MKLIFKILIPVIVVAGCEKEATIDLPGSSEKLVVCCFLSPHDSLISASVRSSKPRYGSSGEPETIDNAAVTISGPDGNVILSNVTGFFEPMYWISHTSFKVVPGETYSLQVVAPGFDPVRAVTTVPADTIPIVNSHIDMLEDQVHTLRFKYSFEAIDLPDQTNYLAIFHRVVHTEYGTLNDGLLFRNWDAEFVDDEFRRQTSYKRQSDEEKSFVTPGEPTDTWIYIDILHCNRDFYLYNRSLRQAGNTNGNPFADPVLIHNNIEGGFGCFGAYYRNRRILSVQ